MAGAFPISTASFETMNFRSIQNTIISKSQSGKKLARQVDGQRFGFTAKIIIAKRDEVYGSLMAFIVKQRSGHENGTVLVNGVHAVGDTTIAMDGFAHDGTQRFKAGDMIKFASHSKVYMVVEDVTASSNAATVTIEPPLTTALTDNSTVTYDNVPFTVHLTNDVQEFGAVTSTQDGNLLYQFELDVEEAL